MYWHDVQPIEQIFPEGAITNALRQIAVRGCDYPNIDAQGLAAERGYHPSLQRAEDFGLHGQGHIADLVEKERAALGLAKGSGIVGECPGEGAPSMAKQLAFQQLCRNRGAVDRNKRIAAAISMVVDCARHQLLARPGPASDQHARVAIGKHADLFLDDANCFARAYQLVFSGHAACGIALLSAGHHMTEDECEIGAADWFCQVIKRAEPHRFDRIGCSCVRGKDRDRRSLRPRADSAQHLQAVHPRHAQIEQRGIDGFFIERSERVATGRRRQRIKAEIANGFG